MTEIPIVGSSGGALPKLTHDPAIGGGVRTIDQDPSRLEHGYAASDARDNAVAVLKWVRDNLQFDGFTFYRVSELARNGVVIRTGFAGGEGEIEVKMQTDMGTAVPVATLRLTANTTVTGYAKEYPPGTRNAMLKAAKTFLLEKAGVEL